MLSPVTNSPWLPVSATASLAVLLAVLGVLGVLCWKRRSQSRFQELAAKIPGPPTVPVLGNAHLFMCDPEDMMPLITNLLKQYGDVVRFWLGPDLNIVVGNPDDLKALLSSPKNSVKGPSYKYMTDYIGGGILSGSGHSWRRHRKIASPNYTKRAIESYGPVINTEVALLLDELSEKTGVEIDVYKDVVRTTSYAVCQSLMGLSREETLKLPYLHNLIDYTHRFYGDVFNRMTKWWYQLDVLYRFTSAHRFRSKFLQLKSAFSGAIIEHRRRVLNKMADDTLWSIDEDDSSRSMELGVIDRFILSKELNDQDLLDETFTIFTSSQEASAKISSYMLLMMAYHPEYQQELYSEIRSVLGERPREVTGADLKHMPYLDMVFKECLRLFPIGAIIQRTVTEEFQISTCTLPAGCSLVAPIYQMQRDPRYWARPNDFYPEHFSRESLDTRPANSYIPFSVGPMDCLGRYFGTKLIKTIVVRVLHEFQLTSNQTYKDLRIKVEVSVASEGGFKVLLMPRQ